MRGLSILVLAGLAAGCMTPPGAPPAPRDATPVAASLDRTWNAVIDAFAAKNLPIANMEKASGFIKSQPLTIREDGRAWADCGSFIGMKQGPDRGEFNAVVRGDGTSSTVKVTASWSYMDPDSHSAVSCNSTGVWESSFESAVRQRAEATS